MKRKNQLLILLYSSFLILYNCSGATKKNSEHLEATQQEFFLDTLKQVLSVDLVLKNPRADYLPGTIINSDQRIACPVEQYFDMPDMGRDNFYSTLADIKTSDRNISSSISRSVEINLSASELASFGFSSETMFISNLVLSNGKIKRSKLSENRILMDAKNPRINGCARSLQSNKNTYDSNFVIVESFIYDLNVNFVQANNSNAQISAELRKILEAKLSARLGVNSSFTQSANQLVIGMNGKNFSAIPVRSRCSINEKEFNVKVDWQCKSGQFISYAAGSNGFVALDASGRVNGGIIINKNSVSGGHTGVCPNFQGRMDVIVSSRAGEVHKFRIDDTLVNYPLVIQVLEANELNGSRDIWFKGVARRDAMDVFKLDFTVGALCQP